MPRRPYQGWKMISFDPLEPRLLLAASLSGGVLTIVGTSAADQIEISHPGLPRSSPLDQLVPDISRTLVRINQDDYEFSTTDIQRLVIHAGDGGRDRLLGGSGNDGFGDGNQDTQIGGAGDDYLNGLGFHNKLRGGRGDDIIYAYLEHNNISGGAGNDLLNYVSNRKNPSIPS